MFRHYDISDDDEAVALASLFENREELVAAPRRTKKRQAAVAGGSDKVQVVSAVDAMQAAGVTNPWYRQHRTRPCKERKDGAPRVREREKEKANGRAGHPPGIDAYIATRGLTVPLRSSIVRAMAAEGAEGAVAAGARANLAVQTVAVDYAAVKATITTAGEARNGQCAAALPIF